MATNTMTYTGELVVETCWCGIVHAVPRVLVEHQQRQHANGEKQTGIYCPLGHNWIISGKGELERQRERAAAFERQLACRDEDLRAERASHAATKGQLTKVRKRASAGICPCCNRSFVQLARHMATKHPDFTP